MAQSKFTLYEHVKLDDGRRYLAGVPLPTLMLELGHESLATTQKYLADDASQARRRKPWRTLISFPSRKSQRQGRTAIEFKDCMAN